MIVILYLYDNLAHTEIANLDDFILVDEDIVQFDVPVKNGMVLKDLEDLDQLQENRFSFFL
jgi:hypothetical protein